MKIWVVDFEISNVNCKTRYKGYAVISANSFANAVSGVEEYLERAGYKFYKIGATTYTPTEDREIHKCKLWEL